MSLSKKQFSKLSENDAKEYLLFEEYLNKIAQENAQSNIEEQFRIYDEVYNKGDINEKI